MLALASMVMFGGYTVLLRVRLPLGIAELLTMVCAFGLLFMVPWIARELAHGANLRISTAGMLGIVYSAVFSQLLAYLGWSHAAMRFGAGPSGVTLHLMAAMGVLLAALFLAGYPA